MSTVLFPPEEVQSSRDEDGLFRSAWISGDGLYRYHLTRSWDGRVQSLPFIMLNPSTANGLVDDPTVRRCMGFARREGFGGITVVNLYGLRATRPVHLWTAQDAVGPANDEVLRECLAYAFAVDKPVVAAWGAHAKVDRVSWLLDQPGSNNLVHFGRTKAGAPRHPLYLRGDAPLLEWSAT